MSLQWIEGWDNYSNGNVTSELAQDWFNPNSGNISVFDSPTITPRTGAKALRHNGAPNEPLTRVVSAANSVWYFGFAWRDTNNAANIISNITTFGAVVRGTTSVKIARTSVDGQYGLWSGTSIAARFSNIVDDVYTYCLVKHNILNGATTVWFNREQVFNGTITAGGANDTVAIKKMSQLTTYDDIFFWNDPSTAEASALEADRDFKVLYSFPVSTEFNNNWDVSGGTDPVSVLDNVPPNSSEFISTSIVSATIGFEFEDITSGLTRVFAVQPQINAFKSDTGNGTIRTAVVISNTSVDSNQFFLATSARYFSDTLASAPDGSPWTVADLQQLRGTITRVE